MTLDIFVEISATLLEEPQSLVQLKTHFYWKKF